MTIINCFTRLKPAERKKGGLRRVVALLLFAVLLIPHIETGIAGESEESGTASETDSPRYIRYIDFDISLAALKDALKYDVSTHESDTHLDFVHALALLSSRNGGNYKGYRAGDLQKLLKKSSLPSEEGRFSDLIPEKRKLYDYYVEAYDAVLGGMVGPFTKVTVSDDGSETRETGYGLRVCSPIAAGYGFQHYDDFGASRSFGYKRSHLGHDLLGSIGTPVVAVESGYVEAIGWNMYGGWRIGIRSFDGKRYYYYAHLRKGHPYADLFEGKIIHAGDIIGYLGMTGYSSKENTNNINVPHLHYGLEVIFDPSQKEGWNQIWINLYELTDFLSKNRVSVFSDGKTGEKCSRTYYIYPDAPEE